LISFARQAHRVDFINAKSSPTFTIKHFRLLQILVIVGLTSALRVARPTASSRMVQSKWFDQHSWRATLHCHIRRYNASILRLNLTHVRRASQRASSRARYRRGLTIHPRTTRLLRVRCLSTHLLNIITGNVAVKFFMTVAEGSVVVAIYVALGVFDKTDPSSWGPIAGRAWKNKNGVQNIRERSRGELLTLNHGTSNMAQCRLRQSSIIIVSNN